MRGVGVLLLAASLSLPAHAEEAEAEAEAPRPERRIMTPRERIQSLRRDPKTYVPPPPPTDEQLADERARGAFEDPFLAPGDVVVTRQGFFLYKGTPLERAREPQDFVRIERRAAGRN